MEQEWPTLADCRPGAGWAAAGSGLHIGVPSVTNSLKDTEATVVGVWRSPGLLSPGPGRRKPARACVCVRACVRACALQDLGRGPPASGVRLAGSWGARAAGAGRKSRGTACAR